MSFNVCIIDGDPLVYRCGFSVEKYNEDLDMLEVEPLKHAFYNINSMMKKILNTTDADIYRIYITSADKSNFRFELFPDYKANRKDSRKPIYYKELREYLCNKWRAETVFGQEADDACSIIHCSYNELGWSKESTNSIVCSFDKDFNNIPGWHYNYVKNDVYWISEIEALRHFYLQILTGDSSDGIPRIVSGWRQKSAEALINKAETEEELIKIVLDEIKGLKKAGKMVLLDGLQTEEDILNHRGKLLWLRRKENELWNMGQ